jgi:glutamine synthetase
MNRETNRHPSQPREPTRAMDSVGETNDSARVWREFCDANPAVDQIEAILPDTNGVTRGKWLPKTQGARLWSSGMALPRSLFALDIWGREVTETALHLESGDRDGTCRPISDTLCMSGPAGTISQVLLTMEVDGEPAWLDPRVQLTRAIASMQRLGFNPVVAFELEFYLLDRKRFTDHGELAPAQTANLPLRNMYSLSDLEQIRVFLEDVRNQASRQRLSTDTMLSEAAPGQYEINLLHQADALRAADEAVLLRKLISGAAARHGMLATFMPKPFFNRAGSGMHVHISLVDAKGMNAFASDKIGSQLLHSGIAGLLSTMAEMTLIFVPSFNGFRRLQPNSYAPTGPSWGHDNRSVAVRVPCGDQQSLRLEHRISGADANPYLVLAALLHGMVAGIEQQQVPPEPIVGNAYDKSLSPLPVDLRHAISTFRTSEFARERFGHEYVSLFSQVKTAELRGFEHDITKLELDTYLV